MKELNISEVDQVSGGNSIARDAFSSGVAGAIGAGGFGAGAGALVGGPPGAAIFGSLGLGVGFVSGVIAYALH